MVGAKDRCSAAMLQRHLGVTAQEAHALIEKMAERGVVGPQHPSGRRAVLVSGEQPARARSIEN